MTIQNSFCFSGLAIGRRYQEFAKRLAADLHQYHPGIPYLVLTDHADYFKGLPNVVTIHHIQKSALFPYHDRRFALREALLRFDFTVQIDTDIKLNKPLVLPKQVDSLKGMWARTENLGAHLRKWQPENVRVYEDVARKLGVSIDDAPYIGEFTFIFSKDHEREKIFFLYWEKIARYLELRRLGGADGPAMGLAAKKAGLTVTSSDWPALVEKEFVTHYKASSGKERSKPTVTEALILRLRYHCRLNLARIQALRDFNFYYR